MFILVEMYLISSFVRGCFRYSTIENSISFSFRSNTASLLFPHLGGWYNIYDLIDIPFIVFLLQKLANQLDDFYIRSSTNTCRSTRSRLVFCACVVHVLMKQVLLTQTSHAQENLEGADQRILKIA